MSDLEFNPVWWVEACPVCIRPMKHRLCVLGDVLQVDWRLMQEGVVVTDELTTNTSSKRHQLAI